MRGVAIGEDGTVDPQQQLFRSSAIGVETGPFISQVRGSAGECGEPVSNFVYAEEKTLGWRDVSYFMLRTGMCCRYHVYPFLVLRIPRRRTRILDRLESEPRLPAFTRALRCLPLSETRSLVMYTPLVSQVTGATYPYIKKVTGGIHR